MLTTNKPAAPARTSIDVGLASDVLQEKHLRRQYLNGQLSEADQETYRKQYGDPKENEANEQLRHTQHLEWVRAQRALEQQQA